MNDLPPDIEAAVERQMASGRYKNVEDVIRAAMKSLEAPELEELQQSLADEEAGRMKPLDEVASRIRRELGLPDSKE